MLAPHLISSMTNKQPLKLETHPSLGWLQALPSTAAAQEHTGMTL